MEKDINKNRCVVCAKRVTTRQEAIQCDHCLAWQHRTCDTAISRSFYRKLTKSIEVLSNWKCSKCQLVEVLYVIEVFLLQNYIR